MGAFVIVCSPFQMAPDRALRRFGPGPHWPALEWLSERMHDFRKLIEPARNRFISHLDLESVRIGEPLGDAPRERWLDFWIDLQEFLHIMYKHHVHPNGHFYLNAVGMMSDADQLVKALRESKYFWALLEDRATTRLASDAANKSKYYEA